MRIEKLNSDWWKADYLENYLRRAVEKLNMNKSSEQ